MDAHVELDVRVGVVDCHRCWGVDVDDLVGGGLVGVACCYAEHVVVRHFEAMQILMLRCSVLLLCGFSHECTSAPLPWLEELE